MAGIGAAVAAVAPSRADAACVAPPDNPNTLQNETELAKAQCDDLRDQRNDSLRNTLFKHLAPKTALGGATIAALTGSESEKQTLGKMSRRIALGLIGGVAIAGAIAERFVEVNGEK